MFHDGEDASGSAGQTSEGAVSPVTRARFEELAMPHLDAVYRMARALARDQAEADDLVQETYIRAWRGFDRFELREYGARPWLLRILHNSLYTLKGKQQRERAHLNEVDFDRFAAEDGESAEEPLAIADLNWDGFDQELKSAVSELPSEYRTVLLLWAIEGLSYKEIAEVCGCPLGTVMSRLYRARQLLAGKLDQYARENRLRAEKLE